MKLMSKTLPFLFAAMLLAVPAFSQTGTLTGKATDAEGKAITGATVSIERQGVKVPRLTEDVWVGRDGRIRRVGLSFPFVQQGVHATSSLTMTFRAYDVPVSISAPPRAQVFDFS